MIILIIWLLAPAPAGREPCKNHVLGLHFSKKPEYPASMALTSSYPVQDEQYGHRADERLCVHTKDCQCHSPDALHTLLSGARYKTPGHDRPGLKTRHTATHAAAPKRIIGCQPADRLCSAALFFPGTRQFERSVRRRTALHTLFCGLCKDRHACLCEMASVRWLPFVRCACALLFATSGLVIFALVILALFYSL